MIDQEPSEQRADHGRHAEYGAEEPLVAPTVARREDVPDHRHRRDDQPSGAESLESAKGDQLSHVLGDTAEGGTDEEDHDRRLQDDLASVEVTELPVHRAGHGRGQEVRRHDPRQVLDAAQFADDRRQRRRHDRLVERRQEEHEQERAEDQSHTLRLVRRGSRRATHEPTLAALLSSLGAARDSARDGLDTGTSCARTVYRRHIVEERTAMRRYFIAAALVALVLPAAAAAKGPVSASISGPALERSLTIRGDGEGPGTALGTLADASGFFAQMFGQSPDPTLATRPGGTLGPRYRVVYVVPGPNDIQSRVVQYRLSLREAGRSDVHEAGPERSGAARAAHGGWYRASPGLKKMLVRAGLPAKAHA